MKKPDIVKPTLDQIENCKAFGWRYIGDGLFIKNERLGWFTAERGFYKD